MKTCSIVGCDRKYKAKDLCAFHYQKQIRKGYGLEYQRNNKEKINESQRENYKLNKKSRQELNKKAREKPAARYATLLREAPKRGITVSLTKEEFIKIIEQPCYYCKYKLCDPVKTSSGLDRIDNNKGYQIDNVLSCGMVCNHIRNEHLTVEETKACVELVIKMRNLCLKE